MSKHQEPLSYQNLLNIFDPSLVQDWFEQSERDEQSIKTPQQKRRSRRLHSIVLFFGIILYASNGLRNLLHAFNDAVAAFESGPPQALSPGSVTPARKRLPLTVLQQGLRHIREKQQQFSPYQTVGGLRVRCLDGTTFTVADTPENENCYGRPKASRGSSGYPQMRCVLMMEAASHIFIDEAHGHFNNSSEASLSENLIKQHVGPGILLEGDRYYHTYGRNCQVLSLGGEFLFRVKTSANLTHLQELGDGSYLAVLFAPWTGGRRGWKKKQLSRLSQAPLGALLQEVQEQRLALQTNPGRKPELLLLRVIEYDLVEPNGKRETVRLSCSVLDVASLPAQEAVNGFLLRWNEEVGIRELKWMCAEFAAPIFPGKSPETVEQDLAATLLAHGSLRMLMLIAAEKHGQDPRRLSLSGTRAVLRRYLQRLPKISEDEQKQWLPKILSEVARQKIPQPKIRAYPRAVKVKMSNYPTKKRSTEPTNKTAELRSRP